MKYTVRSLRRAEHDVDSILSWLSKRSPSGAARWLNAFEAATQRVRSNPLAWSLAPEDAFVDYEVRHIIFSTRRGLKYRLLFTIVETEIRVLHVRGFGQETVRELGQPND